MKGLENLKLRGRRDEEIVEKVLKGERIDEGEALYLYSRDLTFVGALAEFINFKKNQNYAYFIVNRQINPTNICIYGCTFCSFGVKASDSRAYELSLTEILKKVEDSYKNGAKEVHIVGGVPPHWKYDDYINLIRRIKEEFPQILIKAYTAVEIKYMAQISKKSYEEVLRDLKEAGVCALPGGGAEIFSERVRRIIAPYKASGEEYLQIHEVAHKLGIPTNATMLYGHVETLEERIEHLKLLRELQDRTGGFQVFIPLAYWPYNNRLGGERTSPVDDLKTIAIARIYLDNFKHVKAYWITLGERIATLALNFGADDLDGTIEEEKIVHSAGTKSAVRQAKERLIRMIREAGKIPVERDTFYNPLKVWEG